MGDEKRKSVSPKCRKNTLDTYQFTTIHNSFDSPIFDAYVSFQKEIPVFFTDSQFRNQNVYWIIDLIEKDCLIQDFYADRFHLTFSYSPEDGQYLWKTKNIRTVYVIVSLELAENLLRRQMYGLCFSPVLNRT